MCHERFNVEQSLPLLAKGGIVTRSTLIMLGGYRDEPEMIIPIDGKPTINITGSITEEMIAKMKAKWMKGI